MYTTGYVTISSIVYDRTTQTIICTSTGGPATDVSWSKDNMKIGTVSNARDQYEHSQVIVSTANATYENRLTIINKSSKAAGTYACEIENHRGSINESLYIQGTQICTLLALS